MTRISISLPWPYHVETVTFVSFARIVNTIYVCEHLLLIHGEKGTINSSFFSLGIPVQV